MRLQTGSAWLAALVLLASCASGWGAQPQAGAQGGTPPFPADPQTGRAIGAAEMAPEALRALIETHAPVIVIDVRDEAQFARETITGAVHIPFADLEARLKEIPRDRILAFT